MPLWRRVLLGLALGVAAGYAVAALRPRLARDKPAGGGAGEA